MNGVSGAAFGVTDEARRLHDGYTDLMAAHPDECGRGKWIVFSLRDGKPQPTLYDTRVHAEDAQLDEKHYGYVQLHVYPMTITEAIALVAFWRACRDSPRGATLADPDRPRRTRGPRR